MSEFQLGAAGSEAKVSACDCEITTTDVQITREVRTARGSLRRQVVATKRQFGLTYSWLPGKARHTWDGGMGRDELLALYEDGTVMSFDVPGLGVTEDLTVLFVVGSWNERLLERRNDFWAWRVSFGLIEA